MKSRSFTTELKFTQTPVHSISLRSLYMPIIGINSATLYGILSDFAYLNRNSRSYDSFSVVMDMMQISSSELEVSLKKLEAVGLVRTFERTDESKYIIVINEPLSPEAFRKNSFLYKQAISKIGELAYEKVEFSTKEVILNKDDFKEVSAKYQDFFTLQTPEVVNISTTQDIPLIDVKSTEEAIKALNALQFIKFLANENATPTQLAMIQRITQLGLSNASINLIVNYVFNVNGKIVSAHIEKVANDLVSKEVRSFEDVQAELTSAEKSKKTSVFEAQPVSVFSSDKAETTQDIPSWDEIFSSLGGEL